jgi:RNA polymerase sigma-54 factor
MLNLQQKLSQQQKLSPQQIQYIKLLQLPTLALEQRIKTELESNPVLEEGLDEDEETLDEQDDFDTRDELSDTAASEEEERLGEEIDRDEEYDIEDLLNDPDGLDTYKPPRDYSAEEEERDMPMPARVSMAEVLMDQVRLLDFDDTEEVIAEQVIGSIDEDGYLRRPLESIIDDIMFNQGVLLTEADIERVLKRIQRLDPIGIAARDLQECLLIQLEMMPARVDGRDTAIRMLREAYKPFTMKHYGAIKKKLNIDDEGLKEAYDLIQRLDPKPGEGEFSATQNYITPDFTVRFIDGNFIITLNGRNAPELRISRQYRQMLQQLSDQRKSGKPSRNGFDTETRQFLKSKMESARWFINSINQRRHTMMKVMHAIVEVQEDFFKFGEGYLKPMILKDVAELIEMDISTVSRVVNGKYVQTEFGVYELKYFFSEGLTTDSGEEVSNKEVKAIIQSIIDKEDKQKPLSDQKIAKLLENRGFQIARRTVTKYREQLSIPVARLRKEIVLS